MTEIRLYLAQRISAAIMAPLVLVHLGVMIYAIQGGLSAEEILGRTRGSWLWGGFYGLFVCAVAVHAATGLRGVIREVSGERGPLIDGLCWILGIGLLILGLRAVVAVVGAA